jgi:pyruvate-formate lyase-activating enzyme
MSVSSEQLSPYATRLKAEAKTTATTHLASFLGIDDPERLHWDVMYPPKSGLGHLVIRIATALPNDPLVMDLQDDGKASHSWLELGDVQLSLRDSADGLRPEDDTEKQALLAALKEKHSQNSTPAPVVKELKAALGSYLDVHDLYDGAMRQISWADGQHYGILRLSFRCNQDCSFCWQNREWPTAPPEQFHRWLDEMADKGVKFIIFSGGEPTLFKGLKELIHRATHEFGMRVQIQTNAIQLRKERFTQELVDAGLKEAFISFHSADGEISDALTKAPSTHQHTVTGIGNALDAGLKIFLNAVVERANYKSLPDHARFIASQFIRNKNKPAGVVYSHPCHYYDDSSWDDAVVPIDEVRPYVVEAAHTLRKARIPVQVIGSCGFPPCLFKDEPKLLKWVDREMFDEGDTSGRVFPEPCQGCAAKDHCMGVRREYLAKYGTRGLAPFDRLPRKRWAFW